MALDAAMASHQGLWVGGCPAQGEVDPDKRLEESTMARYRFTVGVLIGVLIGVVEAGAFSAPVAAAGPATTIEVTYGSCQVQGKTGANKVVKLVWKDREGDLKSTQSVTAKATGRWVSRCDNYTSGIARGDTIKATVGAASRTFTVPRLTVDANRVTDVIDGVGPADASLHVFVGHYEGFAYQGRTDRVVGTDSGGLYSVAMGAFVDILGDDFVGATWTDAGDSVTRSYWAPAVQVYRNDSGVRVWARPGTDVSVSLSGSDSATFSSRTAIDGFAGGSFTDGHGDGVYVHAGDSITSNIASDATFTVPALSISAAVSTDVVSGTCALPHAPWLFYVSRPSGNTTFHYYGTGDGTGHFHRDMTADLDVKSDDKFGSVLRAADRRRRGQVGHGPLKGLPLR